MSLSREQVERIHTEAEKTVAEEDEWAKLTEEEPYDLDTPDPYNPRHVARLAKALLKADGVLAQAEGWVKDGYTSLSEEQVRRMGIIRAARLPREGNDPCT